MKFSSIIKTHLLSLGVSLLFIFWTIIFFCPVGLCQPSHSLTLSKCIRLALKISPIMDAAQKSIDKANAQIGSARAGFFPSITMSYAYRDLSGISSKGPADPDYLEQRNKTFSINAVETLFAGLTILNGYQKAKLNLKSQEERKRLNKLRVIKDVQQNFVHLLKARAEKKSYAESVKRLELQMKASDLMLKKELIAYADYLSVKVNLANARQKMSEAINAINVATARLKQSIGLRPMDKVTFEGDFSDFRYVFSNRLDECVSLAKVTNPNLRLLDLAIKMARKDYAISVGRYAPRIEINASYNNYTRDYKFMGNGLNGPFDPDQRNEYWITGFTIRWNPFEGGRKAYDIQAASAEVARLEFQRKESLLELETLIQSEFSKLQDAMERIKVAHKTLRQAEENYRRAQKRFFSMIGSRLELLRAQDDLVTAEVNISKAQADYLIAKTELFYDIGVENPLLDGVLPTNCAVQNRRTQMTER